MEALKEIEIRPAERKITIPFIQSDLPVSGQNLILIGNYNICYDIGKEDVRTLLFDTGANTSHLNSHLI